MTAEALEKWLVRLSENDVPYKELKVSPRTAYYLACWLHDVNQVWRLMPFFFLVVQNLCSDNDLNGKDLQSKLRAKVIRRIRVLLGKRVWTKADYGRNFKLPNQMDDDELVSFFEEREIFPPTSRGRLASGADSDIRQLLEHDGKVAALHREEAEKLAFAIMAVDEVVQDRSIPSNRVYEKLTSRDLSTLCKERDLLSSGNKAELIARLQQDDREREERVLEERAKTAAEEELAAASIYVPPRPPNRGLAQLLTEAQTTLSAAQRMDLLQLRGALLSRGLAVYGTREVLMQRLNDILRRDVIQAHAGKGRLLRYADAAVRHLSPAQVLDALSSRGQPAFTGGEEAAARLTNCLVDEWINAAMLGASSTSSSLLAAHFGGDIAPEGVLSGDLSEAAAAAAAQADPCIDVALLCGGVTPEQRTASLAAARAALAALQTDQLWGTLFGPDDNLEAAPEDLPTTDLPVIPVHIATISPWQMGALVDVTFEDNNAESLGVNPLENGTCIQIEAVPVNGSGVAVRACGFTTPVMIKGLAPATEYAVTAALRSAAGIGPILPGAAFSYTTPDRQGVAVQVLYEVPRGEGQDSTYVPLKWEHVRGVTAEELHARLKANCMWTGIEPAPLDAIVSPGTVLLPLGPVAVDRRREENENTLGPVVGSWGSSDIQQLLASRPAFAAIVRGLGYESSPLLELPIHDFGEGIEATLSGWLETEGLDALTTKVAVRAEAVGSVLASGIGRGVDEIASGAAELAVEWRDEVNSLVLEALPFGAVSFSVVVLNNGDAVVALPPTELGYEDLEEDILASDLEVEKFYAVQQGQDSMAMDEQQALTLDGHRLHPSALGYLASPTARLSLSTPPANIRPEVVDGIRSAAMKLFRDLGLKDFAQFRGWVVPVVDSDGADQSVQAQNGSEGGSSEVIGPAEPSRRGRPFAELQAEFENEQEALNQEAGLGVVSAHEKAGAVDVVASDAQSDSKDVGTETIQSLAEPGEAQLRSLQYGNFAGIELDDRTRVDLIAEAPSAPTEPIPEGTPEVSVPSKLPDLSSVDSKTLCCVGGHRIMFSQLDVLPALGSATGPLAQGAAAAGLAFDAIPRALVSLAAMRTGLLSAPLPQLLPRVQAGQYDENESSWPPLTPGQEDSSTSVASKEEELEEIGDAIAAWEEERKQPLPDSYDDIASWEEEGFDGVGLEDEKQDKMALETSGLRLDRAGEAVPLSSGEDLNSDEDEGFLLDEAAAKKILAEEFPGLHPTRQRVWVLCGGEGPERDASVRAAVSVVQALHGEADLLVDTFFLQPFDAGLREPERRRTLLRRRTDLLKIGATDDELLDEAPEFHPTRVRHPPPPEPQDLEWRGVWRLYGTDIVRDNVPDMQCACETALQIATTAPVLRRPGDPLHLTQQMMASVRAELELAGLTLGGPAPWGGSLDHPQPPQHFFLEEWVKAAQAQCVVVLLVLPGHPCSQGPLQKLLESRGVPFTGVSSVGAELCSDRTELLRTLREAAMYGGPSTLVPDFHSISLPELVATCETDAGADELFARLFGDWEGKTLVVRPAKDAGAGRGVARISCGRDLRVYAAALRQWAHIIPATELAAETDDVFLMMPPPTQFVIEPLLTATPLHLKLADEEQREEQLVEDSSLSLATTMDPLHTKLAWPQNNSWLEVRACVVGSPGYTICLGLTTTAVVTVGDDDTIVGTFDVTPPPPSVLDPLLADNAMRSLPVVAECAAFGGGAAEISALISVANGEIFIQEVNANPDLSPDGLLMRQAAQIGRSPTGILRELLRLGMTRGEWESVGEGGVASPSIFFSSVDDYLLSGDDADLLQPPTPTKDSYWGNPHMQIDVDYLKND